MTGDPVIDWTDEAVRLAFRASWRLIFGERAPWILPGMVEVPPPTGYSSWGAYYSAIGGSLMTDYLPLGWPAPEGGKATMVWTRDNQDVATCSLHFVHVTESPDTGPFTDADAATIEGLLTDFWDGLKGDYMPDIQLDRIAWHYFGLTVRKPNPGFRTTLLTPPVAGTAEGAEQLPAQDSVGITLKTGRRRSWGRIYLPAPQQGWNVDGLIADATVDAVADALGSVANDALDAGLPLVVWCPRHDGKLLEYGEEAHAAGLDNPDVTSLARGVWQVQSDNLWDIQRRRRFDRASHYSRTDVS